MDKDLVSEKSVTNAADLRSTSHYVVSGTLVLFIPFTCRNSTEDCDD
jgi:hypothetical protein